jgi:hypothetical protein
VFNEDWRGSQEVLDVNLMDEDENQQDDDEEDGDDD